VSHTLEDLREHLFETVKALRDGANPMSIDRAKAISEVAQTVINSAKAEVDYLRAVGRNDLKLPVFESKADGNTPALPDGVSGIRTHRMRG
jgi:hypothetical protein